MKTCCFILLTLVPVFGLAQTEALDDFYRRHKFAENTVSIRIGNFFLNAGSWFVEDPAAKRLIRRSKRARVLVTEDGNRISTREINRLIRDLEDDDYEPLVYVRDDGDKVTLYLREDRNLVRNLLLMIKGDDEFVMVSLDCKLSRHDLDEVLECL